MVLYRRHDLCHDDACVGLGIFGGVGMVAWVMNLGFAGGVAQAAGTFNRRVQLLLRNVG